MFLFESPHRGGSNEYTLYTIFNKKKITLNLPLWNFSKGLKNEFETAVVDKPSVYEQLEFYCTGYRGPNLYQEYWAIQMIWYFANKYTFF